MRISHDRKLTGAASALALFVSLAGCVAVSAQEGPGATVQQDNETSGLTFSAPEAIAPGLNYSRGERHDERDLVVHVISVDLTSDTMAFATTPADRSQQMEFIAKRTSTYLAETGAILAINASYFLPFAGGSPGGEDYYPHEGMPASASGAVLADGEVVSPVEIDLDLRVNAMVCFEGMKLAIADGQVCPAGFDSGVAAGPMLLASGERRAFDRFDNRYAMTPAPRTAIGMSADGKRGWIVVADGRQEGYSTGASLEDMTTLFIELGASDAINLDGGGSSTLVVEGADEAPRLLNRPIHTGVPGRERPVANHIVLLPALAAN